MMSQKLNGLKMEFKNHKTVEVQVEKIKELTFNRAK